jgi:hypothetical protein
MRAVWLVLALIVPSFALAADTDSDTDASTDTDVGSDSDTYPSGGLGAAALSGEKGGCACNADALSPAVAGLVVAAGLLAARRRQA